MKPDVRRALARGLAFVAREGKPAEAELAAALLDPGRRAAARRALEASLEASAGLVATRTRLDALAALGQREGTGWDAGAARLAALQAEDGSFADPTAAAHPGTTPAEEPAAEAPDADAPLRETAATLAVVARSPCVRPSLLTRAAAYLEAHATRECIEAADPALLEALAGAFASAPPSDEGDAALQWCGRSLERGLRSDALPAHALARLLARLGAHAFPGARIVLGELVEGLCAAQQSDGGWPAAAGDARPAATLGALRGLVHLAPDAIGDDPAC